MAGSKLHRGRRAAALALATGTLCATATAAAGAAFADEPQFDRTGTTAATALHLELNLPGGALSISEDISLVNGQVLDSHVSTDNNVAEGDATLFRGTGPTAQIFDALNKSVKASLDGKLDAHDALVPTTSDPIQLLTIGVGNVDATVTKAGPQSSTSTASVANVDVGLGGQVGTALQGAVTQINGTLTQLTDQITTALGQITAQLPGGNPVTDTLIKLPDQVKALVTQIETSLAGLTSPGGIAHIGLIKSTQTITDDGQKVSADASSQVANVKLLGSLVDVGAISSHSHADADGTTANATVDPHGSIAEVHVGDLADLQLTIDGLSGQLAGLGLPDATATALAGVLDQANQVLGQAGVTLGNLDAGEKKTSCDGTTAGSYANPDGTCAEAMTHGVGVRLAPPGASTADAPLLELALVPSAASVHATAPVPAHLAKPPAAPQALPRTGGSAALTAGLGGLLIAATAFAWRRRRGAAE